MSKSENALYHIQCDKTLSLTDIQALMLLYQPLVGNEVINVYLTLYAQVNQSYTHLRLCTLLNAMSMDTLKQCKLKLEEYHLLRTFYKKETNTYFYYLQLPLSPKDFLSTSYYANLYLQQVGNTVYEQTLQNFASYFETPKDYKELTIPTKHITQTSFTNTIEVPSIQPRLHFQMDGENINFDYDRFISHLTPLKFPPSLRTQENMALIGSLATIHGLSADAMLILVTHSISLDPETFHAERLKVLCERSKPDIVEAKDRYELPPVSFLQNLQKGASVSFYDRKLLERLAMDMHFPPVVINIMIEHILKTSNNRLVPKYVEMVASEWARDNVYTKEKALLQIKKRVTYKHTQTSNIQIATPSYMQEKEEGKQENKDALLSNIQKLKQQMKG